jgi:hypothetical protein
VRILLHLASKIDHTMVLRAGVDPPAAVQTAWACAKAGIPGVAHLLK